MRAIAVCPSCRGDLATNIHPLEHRVDSLLGVPLVLVALVLFMPLPGTITVGLMGVAVMVCLACAVYLHAKTKNWQRYKRYSGEP